MNIDSNKESPCPKLFSSLSEWFVLADKKTMLDLLVLALTALTVIFGTG